MPSSIQYNQSVAPRAASASTPSAFPTTMVSTTVYSCWNILPTISGSAKEMISFSGLPKVISLIFVFITEPLLQIIHSILSQEHRNFNILPRRSTIPPGLVSVMPVFWRLPLPHTDGYRVPDSIRSWPAILCGCPVPQCGRCGPQESDPHSGPWTDGGQSSSWFCPQ